MDDDFYPPGYKRFKGNPDEEEVEAVPEFEDFEDDEDEYDDDPEAGDLEFN